MALLTGLVVLLFERPALGLLAVAFLVACIYTFIRLNRLPTDDEIKKAGKQPQGRSLEETVRAINRPGYILLAIIVLVSIAVIAAIVYYAEQRRLVE